MFNPLKYVVSIGNTSFNHACQLLEQYPFVELRIDLINWTIHEIHEFINLSEKIIITFRPNGKDRINVLNKLNWGLVDYLDIELDNKNEYIDSLIKLTNSYSTKVIWSIHDFEGFSNPAEHYKAFDKLKRDGDIFKFACVVTKEDQVNLLLNAYESLPNQVIIGMGEKGKLSRIKGIEHGALFMYVSSSQLQATAKGQISFEKMQEWHFVNESKKDFFLSGVIGNPISHSKSPDLFQYFYSKNNINACYLRLAINNVEEIKEIEEIVPLKFINITAPFKRNITKTNEAVNYLQFDDDRKTDNTDILGLEYLIKQHSNIKTALIIGSGGAAEAGIKAALNTQCEVSISARDETKSKRLKERFNIQNLPFEAFSTQITLFDLVIWTIPSEISRKKDILFKKGQVIIDANYKNTLSKYTDISQCKYYSGIHWLAAQARPVMDKWGKAPEMVELTELLSEGQAKKKNISLIGLPASGKSTIGKLLAKKLDWRYVDIDSEIERILGKSIAEVFAQDGEIYFRAHESKTLELFSTEEKIVIGTGGGIITVKENRSLLKKNSFNIWLVTSPEVSANRASLVSTRPLLEEKDILNKMNKLHQERLPFYAECANIAILNQEINSTVERIYEEYCFSK